ncbi:signal peptidase I [Candidatus Nomurabacteria bacterium]|nr:signal peptidase I [Candidatus Kaiserbacteria bacterium]MCB9810338.1 signal peptidase I [Candidatus Nomurabacteria bacterium]MCB9818454.1 signal peptidase I [Candidatus Nomurabacteria bacterium]
MSLFSNNKVLKESSSTENFEDQKVEHPLTEIVRFSIIAILIVIPIRMFIAQPFIVSGASMDDTFHSGEYLIVDQVTYHFENPSRGDVIVFRYPKDPSKFFIKRVIGLPGDTITIENSTVTITNAENPDGFALDEPYIKSMQPAAPFSEILGEREYFVMGDNRDQSSDSRSWGVLQEERIIGRALIRLFPPDEISYLPGAIDITNGTNLSTVTN